VDILPDERASDQLPPLRARRTPFINTSLDQARRMLWRAFQHGELTESEFLDTLERLEPPAAAPEA
jgi:hypothetical protein